MMYRGVLAALIVFGLSTTGSVQAREKVDAPRPTTITVIPFESLAQGEHAWLGKGIADLLALKLAEVPALVVLERARLQAFLKEIELQSTEFFSQDVAERVGRVAKIDEVVYGNFSLNGDALTINLIRVELETGQPRQRQAATGTLNELHSLVLRLARSLISGKAIALSPNEDERIRLPPTDSLPAMQRFYIGLEHYDNGRYADAFGAFFSATKRDPTYHDATLWMGKALEVLDYPDLALRSYDRLIRTQGRRVEKFDAMLYSALLLEEREAKRAIAAYRQLASVRPVVPHALEAAHRLAGLLQQQVDYRGAYEALSLIDQFRDAVESNRAAYARQLRQQSNPSMATLARFVARLTDLFKRAGDKADNQRQQPLYAETSGLRNSRFFTWRHALGLYREAIVRMAMLYPHLASTNDQGLKVPPPRGVFHVTPDNPVITEQRLGETPSLFHETEYNKIWREQFYAVVLPPGVVATGAEMRVSGRLLTPSPERSFAMRLLPLPLPFPLPLPRNYINEWLGVIYGQTPDFSTLHKRIDFHGHAHSLLAIQLTESESEIRSWELALHLASAAEFEDHNPIALARDDLFWEGKLVARIASDDRSFYGPAMPIFKYQTHPRMNVALANNYLDGVYLVFVRGELGGSATDLWMSKGLLGEKWPTPESLSINAAGEDYAPRLVRTEDGGVRLFWLSNRRGRGWEVWSSALDRRRQWTEPTRLPLEDLAATGLEGRSDLSELLLHYSVIQDRRGRWIFVYYSIKS